jgi:hypothetical protein
MVMSVMCGIIAFSRAVGLARRAEENQQETQRRTKLLRGEGAVHS